jgi:hypothetical protein
MPTPGEHKTVQSRIFAYAEAIGWTVVPWAQAAELVSRCTVRDLLPQLETLSASLPEQLSSGVETIRALRDEPGA